MERKSEGGVKVNDQIKFPPMGWVSLIISLLISISSLAYSTGIQAQKIQSLETAIESNRIKLESTPAMLNELSNINRRLDEMKKTLDNNFTLRR